MMATRPFIPTLDRMLTRELDRVFHTLDNGTGPARLWVPAMDVVESPDGYLVTAELPGVSPDKVELSFDRNTLTISGTKSPTIKAPEKGELRVYSAERLHGEFERSIRLPEHVDADQIRASFEHGVLTVWVPKSQAAKPRKIAINATPAGETAVEGGTDAKQING